MSDGKGFHIVRTIGTNYGKDNEVSPDAIFCMTSHTVGEIGSNIARIYHFTHCPPAEIHAISGATHKKECMLIRSACSTHDFESCAHSKHEKWLEHADAIGSDDTEAAIF